MAPPMVRWAVRCSRPTRPDPQVGKAGEEEEEGPHGDGRHAREIRLPLSPAPMTEAIMANPYAADETAAAMQAALTMPIDERRHAGRPAVCHR